MVLGAARSSPHLVEMLVIVVVVGQVVVWLTFGRSARRRSEAVVRNWADREGHTVIACERLRLGGSFLFDTTRHQHVYKVTVLRPDGQQAIADLRLGPAWRGVTWGGLARTGDVQIDVRWRDKWGYPAL